MKNKQLLLLLLGLLLAFSMQAQVFNRIYGNNYSCDFFRMNPGYEGITNMGSDTFFIMASNWQEQGYNQVIVQPNGTMTTSFGQNIILNTKPPRPYYSYTYDGNGDLVVVATCGKITTPSWYETFYTSCKAKNGDIYFGGLFATTNSASSDIQATTTHNSHFGFYGHVVPPFKYPPHIVNTYEQYLDSFSHCNNRCTRLIPDDNGLCALGVLDSLTGTNAVTSSYEPATGTNRFKDVGYYIMQMDLTAFKKHCKIYVRSGAAPADQDGMYGLMRDTNKNYVAVGHLKILGTNDRLHVSVVNPALTTSFSKSYTPRRNNITSEGRQVVSDPSGNNYIILGNYYDSGIYVPFVMSMNATSHNINWSYRYRISVPPGIHIGARAWNIIRSSRAGYTITGTCASGMFILRIDNTGTTKWVKAYGGLRGYSVTETSDHGYAAAGARYRCTDSLEDLSIYCVRTDSSGNAFCSPAPLLAAPGDTINWNSSIVAMQDDSSMQFNAYSAPSHDSSATFCPQNGDLAEYPVCPECCFPQLHNLVKWQGVTGLRPTLCLGNSFSMYGTDSADYTYTWYVNNQQFSTSNRTSYLFKTDGIYEFTVFIAMKSNPKCILKACKTIVVLPSNKGFNYTNTDSTFLFSYNDPAYKDVASWKWVFDGVDSVMGTSSSPTNQTPTKTFRGGMHTVCLTITYFDEYFTTVTCPSVVCEDICIKDTQHDCCNCQ